MDDLQTFRAAAVDAGIAIDEIDAWAGIMRFCVVLLGGDGDPAGHLGGLPLLPDDTEWPDNLDFIASIDCAAIPRDGTDITLPADGRLLFFLVNDLEGRLLHPHRVLYVPAGVAVSEREAPDGVPEYPRTDLVPVVAFSTPDWGNTLDLEERVPSGDDLDDIAQRFWRPCGWLEGTIRIGGYGEGAQLAPEELVARVERGRPHRGPDDDALDAQAFLDWVPLAQMRHPSDDREYEFYVPRFMIKRTDLAAGRFDEVVAAADFTE